MSPGPRLFAGGSGTGGSVSPSLVDSVEISFNYLSELTFPVLNLGAQYLIDRVEIIVDTPFNGAAGGGIDVGVVGQLSKYAAKAASNLQALAGTVISLQNGNPTDPLAESVIGTFTPFAGGTAGDARLVVYFSKVTKSLIPFITSISVNPGAFNVNVGATQQLTAIAHYSDSSTQDVTAIANWISGTPAKATVGNGPNKGLVTGVAVGASNITASLQGVSGSSSATVNPSLVSITVLPRTTSGYAVDNRVVVGETIQYVATGHYSDASTADITSLCNWSSNNPGVATVNNVGAGKGQVTGVAGDGGAGIRASLGAILSPFYTANVTTINSIDILFVNGIAGSPLAAFTAPNGISRVISANVNYHDGSVYTIDACDPLYGSWASSNGAVATINNTNGQFNTLSLGASNLSINWKGSNKSISCTVKTLTTINVLNAITDLPENAIDSNTMTAQGVYSDLSTGDVTSFVAVTTNNIVMGGGAFGGFLRVATNLLTSNIAVSVNFICTIGAVVGSIPIRVMVVQSIAMTNPGPVVHGNDFISNAICTAFGIGPTFNFNKYVAFNAVFLPGPGASVDANVPGNFHALNASTGNTSAFINTRNGPITGTSSLITIT